MMLFVAKAKFKTIIFEKILVIETQNGLSRLFHTKTKIL